MKPYPSYKESGVDWLGRVPAHWEIPRLGAVLCERSETNVDGQIADVLSVTRDRGVIPYSEKGNIGNKKSDDITRYKIVRPDDIVVNCMNVIIGSVGLSRYTGCLSPVYYVLKRRQQADMPAYLNAYFQTKSFQLSLVRIGNGILAHRMRIPMELLKCEPFPRPPSVEQAAIVRFLDHADRRIRRYIRAKRRLIGLLNEQKQAIIHQAVTRGLDTNVRLKASGVEWLGDVPEHWEIRQIGHFSKVGNGSTPARSNRAYWQSGEFPWLNSSYVKMENVTSADQFVTSLALQECHLPRLQPGAVLVGITGQGKTRGRATILRINATINQHIAYIAPRSLVMLPEFLQLSLTGFYQRLRAISDDAGGTKGALTCEDIRHFKVALPPTTEQREIILAASSTTDKLTEASAAAEREITLLQEYRTRLIADVVTGKLDVREAAAKLPEELDEEPEDLEDATGEEISESEEESEDNDEN
ncbi:MAG: hypothetical protein HC897_18600 [Thermoanaerobaculia bacterium]|nr:hypothetical protein [Thermoanaerobaculia bacterium]